MPMLFELLCLYLLCGKATVNESKVVVSSSEVQRSGKSNQHAIMPYSLYLRRLHERQRLETEHDRTRSTTQTSEDPQQSVLIYLPSFNNSNGDQISERIDGLQSSSTVHQEKVDSSRESHERTIGHALDNASQEKPTYSTSNSRQPLPFHKSIFRPRTNQIVTNTEQRFQPPSNGNNQALRQEKTVDVVPERPLIPAMYAKKPNLAYGAPFESLQPPTAVRTDASRNEQIYPPNPVYSNIIPAPYNTLSSNTSPNNIVDSIFTQSQLRHAPPHPTAADLIPQSLSPQSINPLQSLTQSSNHLGSGTSEMLNPLQLLGGGGSPLDQITKLARNLLSLPAGNPQLFSAMSKALSSGTAAEGAKLSSSAVIQPASALSVSEATEKIAPAIAAETLITSAKNEDNANSSLKLLNTLPEEQRKLLAAAIQNGELDAATLAPTLTSLLENKEKGVFRSENKLMEWIQQNRPRASDREALDGVNVIAADKLPYYGRYCGSFGYQNSTKPFNIVGSLWAVDERRFIVSKFHYKPGSSNDNVTFWAGPANITGNQADMIPSDNGFYLRPNPINLSVLMPSQVKTVQAKITQHAAKMEKEAINGTAAEIEEMEDDDNEDVAENEVRRTKKDALMNPTPSIPLHFATSTNEGNRSVHLTLTTKTNQSLSTPVQEVSRTIDSIPIASGTEISRGREVVYEHQHANTNNELVPLDWYASSEPLLLTLPEGRSVQQLHWVSVFDHTRKESAAVVWIPNGVAFRVPTSVQFRPLTPNGSYKVSSGAFKVLDTKTIQIENFTLETADMPVWFLVGKEIVPHSDGQIVPVFDREKREFDCNSLRNFYNETVTLRLPGTMDIKDVFWFSVFSIPKSVSLSQIYLPYNDIHLPPDLIGISTPRCIWNPNHHQT
ncbi:DM13 domain-containing protein [Aphelenchoides besseyi]|nr:DM13 domain-containing protein [Aphelenchoides besseyi]